MASLEHQGEKQLFEKFWKGTFKAVATPRPESIIVASITASRKVIRSVTVSRYLSYCNSVSFDDDLSPWPHAPKGKKKKRKSERKRKRKRSVHKRNQHSGGPGEGITVHRTGNCLNLSKTSLEVKQYPLSVCLQDLQSKPGSEVLNTTVVHHHTLTNQSKGPQDYDSGNDTSSPPSTKTSISRTNVIGDKKVLCQAPASPEKLKFTDGDNASDSGNSVTSYASLCKPLHVEGGLSTPIFNGNGKRPQKTVSSLSPLRMGASSRKRTRTNSSSSRSRSSGSSRHSGRYSRSRSLSSARSYSRSPSYLAGLRRKGSEGSGRSRGSYSRYSKERDPSSGEKDVKHSSQKRSGKRHRRRSYSPMRKRRRDSPSHLEARRITSARKRPIPYFRPSPSSSSRSTSVSSWSSLFTRSHSPRSSPGLCLSSSRSRSRSRSRGRSRSRSYFSYRSYSRSSSWNSIFGRRNRSQSRSRSYDSLDGYSKGKNRH
uniref:Serine/arginine repetitive matrix 4 n=1 Tax=Oncorhynchus mykiss TaxID=8022 RepID=A0A8C7UYN6_ONCMY